MDGLTFLLLAAALGPAGVGAAAGAGACLWAGMAAGSSGAGASGAAAGPAGLGAPSAALSWMLKLVSWSY